MKRVDKRLLQNMRSNDTSFEVLAGFCYYAKRHESSRAIMTGHDVPGKFMKGHVRPKRVMQG